MSDPTATPPSPAQMNPDMLMDHIRNNSIWKGVVWSIAIHIVVIGLTSLNMFIDTSKPAEDKPAVSAASDTEAASTTVSTDSEKAAAAAATAILNSTGAKTGDDVPDGIDEDRMKREYEDTVPPQDVSTIKINVDDLNLD